jgi:large subunit ribosomal protein L9
MKVILQKDVAKIGRRFDIVDVPPGYAQNQLIPKGMAEPATPANLKKIQKINQATANHNAEEVAKFEKAAAALKETVIKVPADVNELGHAFKAVSEDDVVQAANESGIALELSMINIGAPIKELGEHQVELHSGDTKITFTIEVIKN